MSIAQVAHKPPPGNSRVDLERRRENHVFQRQAWASSLLRSSADTLTQIMKQSLKLILLVGLRGVIGGPFLLISLPNCYGLFESFGLTIVAILALDGKLDGPNVFALNTTRFVIG